MYEQVEKPKENKSRLITNSVAQKKSSDKCGFGFVDNRPESVTQRKIQPLINNHSASHTIQNKKNKTGLPDNLKSGIENLFGYSMDDVEVHYNSDKPAQLQAHAYTYGTDIHIASGQEKHLLHEAWHVVQQKQRRVKPTKQMKGKVNINDDQGLKSKADIMGKKASLITEDSEVLQNKVLNSTSVVQRAAGFEFETGWHVWDQTNVEIWRKSGGKGKPPDPQPLKKKDLVHDGPGFKVEADEAGAGQAELEFIIHPPIPTTNDGIDSAMERMIRVYLFGGKLLSKVSSSKFPLSSATGDQNDEKFIIQPADNVLGARPQVTAGISLEDIPKLSGAHEGVALPPQLDTTHSSAKSSVLDIQQVAEKGLPSGMAMNPKLMGLLMPISMYISNGQGAVFYPKQIADNFLLARTDFATLFKLLPKEMQLHFKKNTNDFVRLGLMAAGVDDGELPVIGRVWKDEMNLDVGTEPVGPSRKRWLYFITQGYDLLSGSHYKELINHYRKDEPEKVALAKELESMGELGRKTEPTKGDDKEGGIFELRSAALKKRESGIIPMVEWLPFVEQTLTYFRNLSRSK